MACQKCGTPTYGPLCAVCKGEEPPSPSASGRRVASAEFALYDDDSVREKLTVMTKWDAMIDDARNTDDGINEDKIDAALALGMRYRVDVILLGPVSAADNPAPEPPDVSPRP